MKKIFFILFFVNSIRAQLLTGSSPYEPEAQNYFNRIAAVSSDITLSQKLAIDNFVKAAKQNNYWSKLIDISPFVGTNLAAAKVKLKYPGLYASALTATGMIESNYVSNVGIYGATSKYFDTGVNYTNINVELNNGILGGMAFYQNTDVINHSLGFGAGTDIGSGVSAYIEFTSSGGGSLVTQFGGSSVVNSISQGAFGKGLIHQYRNATNSHQLLINGAVVQSVNTSTSVVTNRNSKITIMAGNGTFASTNICSYFALDDGSWTTNLADLYASDVRTLVRRLQRTGPLNWTQPYVPSFGQSLSIGVSSGSLLSNVQTNSFARMPTRGPAGFSGIFIQRNFPPVVELGVETHCSGFANTLSAKSNALGYGHTNDPTVSTYGVSGTAYSGLAKGTAPYQNVTNHIYEAKLLSQDWYTNFYVPAILIVHGENDFNNTSYSNNIVQWQSDFQNDIQSLTGQTNIVPLFHTQSSSWSCYAPTGSRTTSDSPYQVLSAYKVHPTTTVLVSSKYFLTNYVSDGVHLTNSGYRWIGEYYAKAYFTNIVLGGIYQPLYPTNVARSGPDITLTFPTGSDLVLDTTQVTTNSNWGFEFFDDGGPSVTISSVSFVGTSPTNQVKISLTGTPTGGNKRIRYAYTMTSGAKGGGATGPRGNLKRPEVNWTSLYGNNLDDWCVHFDEICP